MAARRVYRRYAGRALIAALPTLNAAVWLAFPPLDDGRPGLPRRTLSEITASGMVLLLAYALLLSTKSRLLERFFGGLDKMYTTHKRAALTAFLLLPAHFALTPLNTSDVKPGTPAGMIALAGIVTLVLLTLAHRVPFLRMSYERWRASHRLTGVFFIIGFAHMMLVTPLVRTTPVPFAVLLAAFAIGAASYLHTVLLSPLLRRRTACVVESVTRLGDTAIELTLRPRRKTLTFTAGQFIFVRFPDLTPRRESHPFTISSSPKDPSLRLLIKPCGDFTRHLHRRAHPGMRATVAGPYGMFDFKRAGPAQIWIAAGIGVTPFLSWIRDLAPQDLNLTIDFHYTVRTPADALHLPEIQSAAHRHLHFSTHLNFSAEDGPLTAARIAATSPVNMASTDIYMCGPIRMMRKLRHDFRRLGVPTSSIHFEDFTLR